MLKTCQDLAKELGRPEVAPQTLPMPGVMQMQGALLDEVVGSTVMEAIKIMTMELGPQQSEALQALMLKYPSVGEEIAEDQAATRIQSIFRGHQARKDSTVMSNMMGQGATIRQQVRMQTTALPVVSLRVWLSPGGLKEAGAQIKFTSEEEAAAMKIQAHARGMIVRRNKMATKTTTTSKVQ